MAGGRPSPYDPDLHPTWAWGLAIEGMVDPEIAKHMGISRATLNNWKRDHPEFLDALKKGKEPTDMEVVKSLLKRANGYDYTERKTVFEYTYDKDGNATTRPVRVESISKHVSPDTGAACMWLKNRMPKKWKDKPEAPDDDTTDDSGFLDALNKQAPEVWRDGDDT